MTNPSTTLRTRKKILVADDDPAILEGVTMILEDAGYEIETTVNAKTFQDLKENFPDLILLDIRMSGIDGRDICKTLKNKKKTKQIPIIMISANKDTKELSKEAGADDFLAKPFEMDELLAMAKKYTN